MSCPSSSCLHSSLKPAGFLSSSPLSFKVREQEVKVNQGDVVKTKQVIGKVAHDEEKGSVLNFEVFKDTEKLNPELWLAK